MELMQHLCGELTWTNNVGMHFGNISWDNAVSLAPESCPYEFKDDHTLEDICKLVKLLPEQPQPQEDCELPIKTDSTAPLIHSVTQYVYCVPCHRVTSYRARSKILKSDEAIEYHMRAK